MNTHLLKFMLGVLFCSTITSFAQQTAIHKHDLNAFDKAVNLYQEQQYQSSQILFKDLISVYSDKNIKAECAYYIASCAIRLNHSNAEILLEEYLDSYPESSNNNQIILDAAFYYFDQGQYVTALKWFEKVNENTLTSGEKEKLNFEKGYCYFSGNNLEEAKSYFEKSLRSKNYAVKANYYLGFLSYKDDDFVTAKKYLEVAAKDEEYKDKVDYLLADIHFNLKEFDKAIAYGEKYIGKTKGREKSDLSKIIGESYFNLKEYKKAIPYLEGYDSKFRRWNNTDYYQLGYAYYQFKEYEKAISQFNKIIEEKNIVTQNAYYHLGESYLKLDKKPEAFNAFKNASEMDFEPKIQEDAYYNYAKLSYELGNPYVSAPEVLTGFLNKYPQTTKRKEIEILLVNSYITSKNYRQAVTLLEKNKYNGRPDIYQKATFLLGVEQYTNGEFEESLQFFDKSLSVSGDKKYKSRAQFWKAESEYVLGKYDESLKSYKQFLAQSESSQTDEMQSVYYNLGYVAFKQKQYDVAIEYFQKYVNTQSKDKIKLNDAYLRLGDCNYVSAKYWPAMDAYNKAVELDGASRDYAFYQKALCYGYVDRRETKIENLSKFSEMFSKSKYIDDATFELANTYAIVNKDEQAITTYDKLIRENKQSIYVSKSLLRQALIYYNQDKNKEALLKLKKVVADFPSTPEAVEAVATAKVIYLDLGQVDEYAKWVKNLGFIEVSDLELDNLTFESAEKKYLQGNTNETIKALVNYVSKFPQGANSLKANYYLAQTYIEEKQDKASVPHYEFVLDKVSNEYTEQSLSNLSQIFLKGKEYVKAIPVLQRLEKEANTASNVTYAESNLMKSFYEVKQYQDAVAYADKVLNKASSDPKAKSDGQVILARSAIKLGNEAKAKEAYKKLSGSKGELGAEVLFYDAYFQNKEGKFADSNKTIQVLAKDYSGYKYYGAKGLIVMANNFYKLKDIFQATYVLEMVMNNFAQFPDIVEEARVALQKIKDEQEFEMSK